MKVNRSAMAASAFWIGVASNVGAFVADLYLGRYHAAAAQSLVLAGIAAVAAVYTKLHARLDAQLAEAVAQRDTAELILKEIQQLAQRGGLQVGVAGEVTAARTH